jgi:ribonuclease Z
MGRIFLATVILLSGFVSFGQTSACNDSVLLKQPCILVTLLGTGDPQPVIDRFGPSILVQAGGLSMLFDAGRGCLQRLRQVNLSYDKIDALFLTHLHSDHIVGLPDLWLTGWLLSRRERPLSVFGPEGTKEMLEYLQKAFDFDIKIRIEDDKMPKGGGTLSGNVVHEGRVFEKNGVSVIAFEVDHGPVKPAFGYRIEYMGHSVVLSGDTRYSANLIKFAKGTDLLVHEVVIGPDTLSKSDIKYPILAHHTTPEQASMVFQVVKPKLAVYSHIVRLYGHNEQDLISRTKLNYPGLFVVGEDLMSFLVTDTVSVISSRNK